LSVSRNGTAGAEGASPRAKPLVKTAAETVSMMSRTCQSGEYRLGLEMGMRES
jgi:hypothetical protein